MHGREDAKDAKKSDRDSVGGFHVMLFSQGKKMSTLDFWAGRQAANIANHSSTAGADKAIAELSRFDPSTPLLRAEEEERIVYARYYEKLESLGYEVNRDGNTFKNRGKQ